MEVTYRKRGQERRQTWNGFISFHMQRIGWKRKLTNKESTQLTDKLKQFPSLIPIWSKVIVFTKCFQSVKGEGSLGKYGTSADGIMWKNCHWRKKTKLYIVFNFCKHKDVRRLNWNRMHSRGRDTKSGCCY